MREVTVQELKSWKDNKEDFQLVDVREPNEFEFANIGGDLVPLSTLDDEVDKIDKEKKVVVMCRSGNRSARAIEQLEDLHGYENLYNLKGGILAWSDEVDKNIPKY